MPIADFDAIINPPQAVILAVGAIRENDAGPFTRRDRGGNTAIDRSRPPANAESR